MSIYIYIDVHKYICIYIQIYQQTIKYSALNISTDSVHLFEKEH